MSYYRKFKETCIINTCSTCKNEIETCDKCGCNFIEDDLIPYCNKKFEDHICGKCLAEYFEELEHADTDMVDFL